MNAARENAASAVAARTKVERKSDREVVVRRTFDAPKRLVFDAWTRPELFQRWWVPKSIGISLVSCEMDVRVGGSYRLVFGGGESGSMIFHGHYREVVPNSRLVWTNEESTDGPVTTVTFEEKDGKTHLTLQEVYSSKEAFEAAGGMEGAMPEVFGQLDEFLVTMQAG